MSQGSANGSCSSASPVSCRRLSQSLIFSLFTGEQMLSSIKNIPSNSSILLVTIILMSGTKQSGPQLSEKGRLLSHVAGVIFSPDLIIPNIFFFSPKCTAILDATAWLGIE